MGNAERVILPTKFLARSLQKPRRKGKLPTFLHDEYQITSIPLVTSALQISMKIGMNMQISVHVNPFLAKFRNFSVKGSLFSQTDFSVASMNFGGQ